AEGCTPAHRISPCVLVARRGDQLAAVLPLSAHCSSGEATGASLLADYNDIIAGAGDLAASVALLKYAGTVPKPYQSISLRRVRVDSNCILAAVFLNRNAAHVRYHREGHYSHIEIPAGYEKYLRTRSGKFRRGLAQARRRAATCGILINEIR